MNTQHFLPYHIFSSGGASQQLSFDEHPQQSDFRAHTHRKTELLLLLEGDVEMTVGGENYPLHKSHLLIIPQGISHKLRVRSPLPYLRLVLSLPSTYLEELGLGEFAEMLETGGVRTVDLTGSPFLQTLYPYSKHIAAAPQIQQRAFFDERVSSLFLALLEAERAHTQSNADGLAERAIRYINANLSRRLTIESIAEALYTSPSYLCKVFRRKMEIPMMHYVNRLRIRLAQSLMIDGTPLKEVYVRCGFENYVTFFRVFREETGKSPSEFLGGR